MKSEIQAIESRVKSINMSLINISISVQNGSYDTLSTIATHLGKELTDIQKNMNLIKDQLSKSNYIRLKYAGDVYEDMMIINEEDGTCRLINLCKNTIIKDVFKNKDEVSKYIQQHMIDNHVLFLEK